jgi:hypothetical protein
VAPVAVGERDVGVVGSQVVDRGAGHAVAGLPGGVPGLAKVFGQLGLAVHPDAAPGELGEVKVMPLVGPLEIDAAVLQPFSAQAIPEAPLVE